MAKKKTTDKKRRTEVKKQQNAIHALYNSVRKAVHVYKHYKRLDREDIGEIEGKKCALAHSAEAQAKFEVELKKLRAKNGQPQATV